MGNGMSQISSFSGVSLIFAVIILVVCALLVSHIVFTLWQKRNLLHQLSVQHSRLVHSVPMSLGIISSMTICAAFGEIMNGYINATYIAGLLIGILVSGIISLPFKDELAILDGIVSGSMGGLMGVMIDFMIPKIGLYTIIVFLTLLFTATWVIMHRRIYRLFIKTASAQMEHHLGKTELY